MTCIPANIKKVKKKEKDLEDDILAVESDILTLQAEILTLETEYLQLQKDLHRNLTIKTKYN